MGFVPTTLHLTAFNTLRQPFPTVQVPRLLHSNCSYITFTKPTVSKISSFLFLVSLSSYCSKSLAIFCNTTVIILIFQLLSAYCLEKSSSPEMTQKQMDWACNGFDRHFKECANISNTLEELSPLQHESFCKWSPIACLDFACRAQDISLLFSV